MNTESPAISMDTVRLRYGRRVTALAGVNLDVATETITGLIGRNGAGKSSLMRVVAGREARLRGGTVALFGVPVLRSRPGIVHLCGEKWPSSSELRVSDLMRHLERVHTRFDRDRALDLLETFDVPTKQRLATLSRGQRSAAHASLALATRAHITLLDEPQLGMDAPSRAILRRACVEEQSHLPRALVISTHLIDEFASLMEKVVILDRGRVVVNKDVDELCAAYVRVEGPRETVARLPTLQPPDMLGATSRGIVLRARLSPTPAVHLSPVTLQELLCVLTSTHGSTT